MQVDQIQFLAQLLQQAVDLNHKCSYVDQLKWNWRFWSCWRWWKDSVTVLLEQVQVIHLQLVRLKDNPGGTGSGTSPDHQGQVVEVVEPGAAGGTAASSFCCSYGPGGARCYNIQFQVHLHLMQVAEVDAGYACAVTQLVVHSREWLDLGGTGGQGVAASPFGCTTGENGTANTGGGGGC
jgi:hypothetical protein